MGIDEEERFRRDLVTGGQPWWKILGPIVWLVVGTAIGFALTQPWPSRFGGGGGNPLGPIITIAIVLVPFLLATIVYRLLKKKR